MIGRNPDTTNEKEAVAQAEAAQVEAAEAEAAETEAELHPTDAGSRTTD